MKTSVPVNCFRLIAVSFCFTFENVSAQHPLISATYAQDFNNLPNTGTTLTVAAGNLSNVNASLDGWYFSEAGSGANTSIRIGSGSSSTGDTYSFGIAGNTDRALGGLQSGTLNPTIGFYFINNTGATITSLTISYTGEIWRIGATSRTDQLDFQFSSDATSLTNGTWTDFDALDFVDTASSIASGSLLQFFAISNTLTGLTIANGAAYFIRWRDFNASGSDDGMGIDDITISAGYAGESSNTADYFRSNALFGQWGTPGCWQSSADGVTNWITATLFPTSSASGIFIQSNHTITISSATTAAKLEIQNGATLVQSKNATFNIADAGGTDLIIYNGGTFVLNGSSTTLDATAAAQIQNSAIVRVDDNAAGGSDNFARLTNVEFQTGSVFLWNTTDQFQTANVTYFRGPNYTTNKPIFRVAADVSVGANSITIFNCKLESTAGNPQFRNSGTKIFRDGVGGTGTITHSSNCGPFQITANDAVIDGTITLNINNINTDNNDLEIATDATVTISGSPTITVGQGSGTAMAYFLIHGALINNSTNPIDITYGNLEIDGYLDLSSTGTFTAGTSSTAYTTVTIGGIANTSAGALALTAGNNYVSSFTMNRGTSSPGGNFAMASALNAKSFTLTKGVLSTGSNLVTWLNTDNGVTSKLTLPSAYDESFIATSDVNGNSINITSPYDGSVGFRINNVGNSNDIVFPVGATFLNSGTYAASPNRMLINNSGISDHFTAVVKKETIPNTALPGVNRVWYVSEGSPGLTTASIKLYFTKRSSMLFPSEQDEVEPGFVWSDPHLVQENYSSLFVNNSAMADLTGFTGYGEGTEVWGQYTYGVSTDISGTTNGITGFTRFSVVNANGIILPGSLANLKAYQKGNDIQIEWSALNEVNVNRYEIERSSSNNLTFRKVGTVNALNNGNARIDYRFTDIDPNNGKNLYRIKAVDIEGRVIYSGILSVNIADGNTFVMIYPNPVHNRQINLQLNNLPQGKYEMIAYNFIGQQVLQKYLQHPGGFSTQNIVMPTHAKSGIYIVKIKGESGNYTARIMIE